MSRAHNRWRRRARVSPHRFLRTAVGPIGTLGETRYWAIGRGSSVGECMIRSWKQMLNAHDWDGLEDFSRHVSQQECAEVSDRLGALVPRVTMTNGTEVQEVLASPDDVPPELSGAAKILLLGEREPPRHRLPQTVRALEGRIRWWRNPVVERAAP